MVPWKVSIQSFVSLIKIVCQGVLDVSVLKHNRFGFLYPNRAITSSCLLSHSPESIVYKMLNCTVEPLISLGPGCLRVIFISQQTLEFFQGNPAFYSRRPSRTTANFTTSPVYKYIHLFLEALKSPFMLLMCPFNFRIQRQTGSHATPSLSRVVWVTGNGRITPMMDS